MTILTLAVFVIVSALIVLAWNKCFRPVPLSVALILWLFCAVYQARTLFTSRVDIPANLAYVAYPWMATGRPAVQANTGIVFTQIAPWSRIARDIVLSGEVPLWNRTSGSGAPLLANQQTAIYHPFTLLGLILSLGKSFTLSACLRLFTVAFFTFIMLRNWEIGTGACVFGAVAYTFCSFHVVWLLFPLGLTTMMLPLCLVGVQETVQEPRASAYALLVLALSFTVLGGHPESALWVWIVTIGVAVPMCVVSRTSLKERVRQVTLIGSAFVLAMLLTAFFWYPTLKLLEVTARFESARLLEANPADHGLTYEWLLPIVTPNILGNPGNGTYTPPKGFHPAVLNDYGEVASCYAGLMTLGLALAAPFLRPRRPIVVALALMTFSLLTFAEAPGWRDLMRAIPLAGISIHQRLRVFWDLGICIAAAVAIDTLMRGEQRRWIASTIALTLGAFAVIYAIRRPPSLSDPIGLAQMVVPVLTTLVVLCVLRRERLVGIAATLLVFLDLVVTTYRYNPDSKPADVYPATGAIETLQRAEKPFRFAAWSWSFLPDTPGYYGIEDVKTTDPIQYFRYIHLMKGYLNAGPASPDQVLRDASQPFFDYLNIKYIYVPPGQLLADPRFVPIYRGSDGVILQNTGVLPRYFFVPRFSLEPDFGNAVARSKHIRDFSGEALVDHIPATVLRAAPELGRAETPPARGDVRIRRYNHDSTTLDIVNDGWNLLVSSEVDWPGWRIYWNGERQPSVTVNGAFVGCFVPPGTGRLEFRYRPDEFDHGLIAGLAGVFLASTLAVVTWRKERMRQRS